MQKVPALTILLLLFVVGITAPAAQAFNCCRAADVNQDGKVDQADLAEIDESMGEPSPRKDLDGDGRVDMDDRDLVKIFEGYDCSEFCRADLDENSKVDGIDQSMLEDALGQVCSDFPECPGEFCARTRCQAADLNRNGTVELNDRWFLLAEWGACPGSPTSSTRRRGVPNPCAQGPDGR